MLLKSLRFISIVCAALALGLTTTHVLERPGKAQLSGVEWLTVQQTFYGGFAVVGGIAEVLGLLASVGVLVQVRGQRRSAALTLLGVLGFVGMLLSYALGNRPINDHIAVWTAASLPPDWATYRDRWDNAHTISAGLAALALIGLLTAALRDPPRGAERAADGESRAAASPEPVAGAR